MDDIKKIHTEEGLDFQKIESDKGRDFGKDEDKEELSKKKKKNDIHK